MENIFSFITERYAPAAGFTDADYMPTTAEMLSKLKSHTGNEDLKADEIFDFLKNEGYEMEELSELHFVWLLKSRE